MVFLVNFNFPGLISLLFAAYFLDLKDSISISPKDR